MNTLEISKRTNGCFQTDIFCIGVLSTEVHGASLNDEDILAKIKKGMYYQYYKGWKITLSDDNVSFEDESLDKAISMAIEHIRERDTPAWALYIH
jgi:hypothetical protein